MKSGDEEGDQVLFTALMEDPAWEILENDEGLTSAEIWPALKWGDGDADGSVLPKPKDGKMLLLLLIQEQLDIAIG